MNFNGKSFLHTQCQDWDKQFFAKLLFQVELFFIHSSYLSVTLWVPSLCWGIILLDSLRQFIPSIFILFSVPWTTIKVETWDLQGLTEAFRMKSNFGTCLSPGFLHSLHSLVLKFPFFYASLYMYLKIKFVFIKKHKRIAIKMWMGMLYTKVK